MIRRAVDFLVLALGWTAVTLFVVVPITLIAIFLVAIVLVASLAAAGARRLDPWPND